MKNTDDFHYERKPSRATATLTVSKDEWDTKEDTGKSMKNAILYCIMPKGTSWAEAMSNNEPVALAVIELRLSEGISQSVENSI